MAIIFFYTIPAVWLGGLVGYWLLTVFAEVLLRLPSPVLEGMTAGSGLLLASGVLLTIGGHLGLAWEMLANRETHYNLDAITTYIGAALVAVALLLLDWGSITGTALLAGLIAPNIGISLVRLATLFTRTAFGTLGLLLGVCGAVLGLTWVTAVVM